MTEEQRLAVLGVPNGNTVGSPRHSDAGLDDPAGIGVGGDLELISGDRERELHGFLLQPLVQEDSCSNYRVYTLHEKSMFRKPDFIKTLSPPKTYEVSLVFLEAFGGTTVLEREKPHQRFFVLLEIPKRAESYPRISPSSAGR